MPIACTRCGEKQEGEILNVNIAFRFPHAKGCGQGIGPLAVIKGQIKKPEVKKEVKVDEKPKEKIRVFGNDEEKKSKSSRFNKKE
jgi:hypothetical protein